MPRIQLSLEETNQRYKKSRIKDLQNTIKREKIFNNARPRSEKDLARFGDISDVSDASIRLKNNETFEIRDGHLSRYINADGVKFEFYDNGNVRCKSFDERFSSVRQTSYAPDGKVTEERFNDGRTLTYDADGNVVVSEGKREANRTNLDEIIEMSDKQPTEDDLKAYLHRKRDERGDTAGAAPVLSPVERKLFKNMIDKKQL